MFRFAFHVAAALALATVALAGAASAEVTYYVEDFENNGEPGFDPMFHHEFSADPGNEPFWVLFRSPYPSHLGEVGLYLDNGTTDTITFELPSSLPVIYGSVVLHDGLDSETSVRFVGSENTWQSGPGNYGQTFVEIDAAQVGNITKIELYSTQGIFYDVTIGVVPEPSDLLLGTLGLLTFWPFLRKISIRSDFSCGAKRMTLPLVV